MSAPIRVEDDAFSDPRMELLGVLAGYNRFEALGRMAHLWRVCTNKQMYYVTEATIVACLGERGVEALIGSELGEKTPDGIRVRGTEGRIEWLGKKRTAAKAGGLAKSRRVAEKRAAVSAKSLPLAATRLPDGSHTPAESLPLECQNEPKRLPDAFPLTLTLTSKREDAPTKSDARLVTEAFFARYESAYGRKPAWSPKEGAIVKRLLGQSDAAEILRRMAILFDHPPDWLHPPFDIGTLSSAFNRLVVESAPRTSNRAQPDRPAPQSERLS